MNALALILIALNLVGALALCIFIYATHRAAPLRRELDGEEVR